MRNPLTKHTQGIVVSGLGVLYTATDDASYLTEAEKTIDAVVAGMSEGGILREPCDDASSNNCNSDQQLFKGVFMKHLEYYLDQAKYEKPLRDYLPQLITFTVTRPGPPSTLSGFLPRRLASITMPSVAAGYVLPS